MTIGEVLLVIEAYHERERMTLISRISSILRALSKKGDAYKGLNAQGESPKKTISWRDATRQWLWQSRR